MNSEELRMAMADSSVDEATELQAVYRDELEAARAEIARLKTWDGLMSILDRDAGR